MNRLLVVALAWIPLAGCAPYYGLPTAYVEGVPVAYGFHPATVVIRPYGVAFPAPMITPTPPVAVAGPPPVAMPPPLTGGIPPSLVAPLH